MLKKRGLSPVIATMLLITLALILAIIIYLWARSFIGESIEKEGRAIALSCEQASFQAEASTIDNKIRVINLGSVPIYGLEVRKSAALGDVSAVKTLGGTNSLLSGQSAEFDLPSGINSGDGLVLVPVLLGETNTGTKSHICDESYQQRITVG